MSLVDEGLTAEPNAPMGQPVAGVASWPIPPVSLAALADMGMSDDAIGRYFGVEPSLVRSALTAEPDSGSMPTAAILR